MNCKKFFCLVVGSRTFDNYELMKEKLDKLLVNQISIAIVSGGAKGADSLAKRYAQEKGYSYYEFPADWSQGKSAGYKRNEEMHRFISHFPKRGCVAFWDGKSHGTAHNFELGNKYGNSVKKIMF